MAFLDNSGDIILDAVLTDTGRLRLAKGDGSFKIAKFVLADDEINYGLYDKNHASGSAYYDLDILQTPIFEAFTNNTSVVKHTLMSISRTNLLYLPTMKLNQNVGTTGTGGSTITGTPLSSIGLYIVATDDDSTITAIGSTAGSFTKTTTGYIRIDQGIDSEELSSATPIDSFLNETQYIIELDNRLGRLNTGGNSMTSVPPSFIDDDNVASYYASISGNSNMIENIITDDTSTTTRLLNQVIRGPRGTCIGFQVKPSVSLNTSTYLFTTLGSTFVLGSTTYYYIDTNLVVRGVTTGSSISIPIRFIKAQ